jgi:hypothetical protein
MLQPLPRDRWRSSEIHEELRCQLALCSRTGSDTDSEQTCADPSKYDDARRSAVKVSQLLFPRSRLKTHAALFQEQPAYNQAADEHHLHEESPMTSDPGLLRNLPVGLGVAYPETSFVTRRRPHAVPLQVSSPEVSGLTIKTTRSTWPLSSQDRYPVYTPDTAPCISQPSVEGDVDQSGAQFEDLLRVPSPGILSSPDSSFATNDRPRMPERQEENSPNLKHANDDLSSTGLTDEGTAKRSNSSAQRLGRNPKGRRCGRWLLFR